MWAAPKLREWLAMWQFSKVAKWQYGWQQCSQTEQAAGKIQPAAAVLLSWQPWQHFPRHQGDPGIPGFHIRKLPRLSSLFVKPN